jgi:Protein of unknown function (DUF1566)
MTLRPSRIAFFALAIILYVLPENAEASPCHYIVGEGAAAGTVYDTGSKLTWQRDAPPTLYDMKTAHLYCSTLDLDGTGWRVPTAKEMYSLVSFTALKAPFIDTTVFRGTSPTSSFWTATGVVTDPTSTWIVYFGGTAGSIDSIGGAVRANIRCVR